MSHMGCPLKHGMDLRFTVPCIILHGTSSHLHGIPSHTTDTLNQIRDDGRLFGMSQSNKSIARDSLLCTGCHITPSPFFLHCYGGICSVGEYNIEFFLYIELPSFDMSHRRRFFLDPLASPFFFLLLILIGMFVFRRFDYRNRYCCSWVYFVYL